MLTEVPSIFNVLFEKELMTEIQKAGELISVTSGTTLFKNGDEIRLIPIVVKGSIKVTRIDEDGHELLLYYLTSSEGCAMTFTSSLQHDSSKVNAMAEDDCSLVVIPAAYMNIWMGKYHTWKSFVLKTINDKFNELLKTVDQIAFQKLDERLISYLKEKSKVTGSRLINLSHEQIANELATSRVVISRMLKKLENDKKVLLYRNQIKLMNEL
ncbi:MAG: Crp/Fnr family transcriptional regulator [Bacteroidia bacterium]|jgi:CRP/FNR family transcriptional regulator|nr:Crp/Fnr family transcriptional regulator [Bacteroidia bacterium]